MTPAKSIFDFKATERFLTVRGWTQHPDDFHAWVSPCGFFEVFLDADIETAAITHLEHVEGTTTCTETHEAEVSSLEELARELVSLGAMPFECPNCGDVGGEPRTATSEPYLYGADADGNRGEMRTETTEGCSKCIKTYWRD
jgi:hypothetical protein